jgi:hypothetical protein
MSSSGTGLGADLQGAKPEAGQYGKREKDRIEKCVREKTDSAAVSFQSRFS